MINVRCDANRFFRKKKREHMLDKLNQPAATYNWNKDIRDIYIRINKFKKGYEPSTNLMNDKIGRF
jgi:hypothetical protein